MKRKPYVPDLGELMAQCEINYRRLIRLIPELPTVGCRAWSVVAGTPTLHLEVLERARYTTTLRLTQDLLSSADSVARSCMTVRLYHDARLAEVTAYQGQAGFAPVHPYPNPEMRHRDEKQRLNEFLGDWLFYCLARGHQFAGQELVADA